MQVNCINMKNSTHSCREELKGHALKVTPIRLAVLDMLEHTKKPVDIALIREYLEKRHIHIDPATIFRTVNTFTAKGITKQVQLLEGRVRYELSSRKEHHHLVCDRCGSIEDISDCSIGKLEKEIRNKKGFITKSHSLEFFGICKDCQS